MTSQTYAGNPSLPNEVRQRVISTFRQSVDLFREGNRDDALAGCDYILKMDPMFDPATQLMEKIGNPAANVDVDNLVAMLPGNNSIDEARDALRARDFSRALDLTSEVLRSDFSNMEAQQIAEDAQSRLEAAPFIEQFVTSARAKLNSGNPAGASADLQKAKQLDADHPLVVELDGQLSSAPPADSGFASPFGSGFSSSDPFGAPAESSNSFGAGASFGDGGFGQPDATQQPESAFVVDGPASGKAGAQASDFGFTFEEDQPPAAATDFSFGSAAPFASNPFAGASVGEGQTFDFTTASVETTEDDKKQIDRYLEDGDAAFEVGDYQKAIDVWSKIFLIDVTNDDASGRIEKARAKRQEVDRRIEELMVAGTLAFEKRDSTTARAKFEEVLALDPNHFNARDYMEKIDGRADIPPSSTGVTVPDESFFDDEFSGLKDQPLTPPDDAPSGGFQKAKPAVTKPATTAKGKLPLIPILAVVGLLVLGAVGYFGYTKFFNKEAITDPAATQALFKKAEQLANAGKYDEAIRLLSGISPGDPEHDRALEMIGDLKQKKAQTAGVIDGRPAAEVFAEFVTNGRTAYEGGDFLTAKQMFEQALAIQTLPPDVRQMLDESNQQVAKLESALLLLREGRYNEGIANLEGVLQQDPQNASVKQLLGRAHFNYAVAYLQQENTQAALAELDQVLKMTPGDAEAKRTRELAAKYDGDTKDLLYKIYVKYLPVRAL